MNFLLYLIVTLFVASCFILMLLVLIQKGRGGGLSGAFGGGAGGHTAFGSKTGDVLTWATSVVFGVFLLLAILANLVFNSVSNNNVLTSGAGNYATPAPKRTAPSTPAAAALPTTAPSESMSAPATLPALPAPAAAVPNNLPAAMPTTLPSTPPSMAPPAAPSTQPTH